MTDSKDQINALERELAELRRERSWHEAGNSGSAKFGKQAVEKIDKDIEAIKAKLDELKNS